MIASSPGRVLSEHAALVEAPAGRVRAAVLAVPTGRLTGPDAPLVLDVAAGQQVVVTGGPDTFQVDVAGTTEYIDVDRAAGWVQVRGQWWFCGRLQVDEHPQGSRVTQSVYNLATGPMGALVPWTVGRGHAEHGHRALRRVLRELARRHGWAGRLLAG